MAIKAGVRLFNGPKHKAGFRHTLPVPNATVDPKTADRWKVVCARYGRAAADGSFTPADTYFSFEADLSGLTAQPVSTAAGRTRARWARGSTSRRPWRHRTGRTGSG